jgi:hypothetical protein
MIRPILSDPLENLLPCGCLPVIVPTSCTFTNMTSRLLEALDMVGSTTQLGWSTAFIGALVALVIAHFWRPPKTKTSTIKRPLTLRIDEVPVNKLPETLECDIKSIVEGDPDLKAASITIERHFLVARDQKIACATATFYTSISADELISKLDRVRASHPYRFDVKFHGITPLYEAAGADVE